MIFLRIARRFGFLSGSRRLRACEILFGVCAVFGILASEVRGANEAISCPTGASAQTVTYGTVASCRIELAGESDVFSFNGASGDVILVLLVRTGGSGTVCLDLEDPAGQQEVSNRCTTSSLRLDWILAGNGLYDLDVYEYNETGTVEYTLTLERTSPVSPAAQPITLGQARSGELNPAADIDIYSFSGSPGQTVVVTVFRLAGGQGVPCLETITPAGQTAAPPVCNATAASATFSLTSSSPYVLLVYTQSQTGTPFYSIHVKCSTGCPPPPPPPDLSRCLNPRFLRAHAVAGSATFRRFLTFGSAELANCALPDVASFTATVKLQNGTNWLTVSPASGQLVPGAPNALFATFDPVAAASAVPAANGSTARSGGTVQGLIEISVPSFSQTVKVPVAFSVTSGPELAVSWDSFAFQTVELTSAPPPQSFRIFSRSPGTLNWVIEGADPGGFPGWISISPLAGTASNTAGSTVTISVNPAGLTAGSANNVYNSLVKVSAPNASNSPQYISVSFHVVRPTAAPVPLLTGYGLVFHATQGAASPPPQSCGLSNTGGGNVTATVLPATFSGGNWLSVSKTNLSTAGGPDNLQIFVNHAGLSPGLYRGQVRFKFDARNAGGAAVPRPDQVIDVLLIVSPPAAALQRNDSPANGCAPTRMEMVGATVGNGLNVPVSFPQPLLTQVLDDCGQAVTGATAVAVADGLTVPLTEIGGGLYSGTWTPAAANPSATISFAALHPQFAPAQQTFTVAAVTASGGTVLPTLFSQGVVEGAGFTQGRPLVPGGIISLFGMNLAPPGTAAAATTIPLERSLAQTRVRIGNSDAPLYFVSPGQINAQLPFEAVPGETVTIVVNANGRLTVPQQYQIAPAQPGLFHNASMAAVLDEQFRPVSAQNPARIGRVIQIFATGLGATTPQVATGEGAPASSTVALPVTVTIGGIEAAVQYQGLAPGFVGLYQVNAVVPQGVTPGNAVPITITQNGVPSNPDLPATLPVAP
ncbi:MAG TPA: hypothetical protein VNN17_04685 [Terriglobia bacterium]|nr:hypothetical protein [Terriglobia bacterium]